MHVRLEVVAGPERGRVFEFNGADSFVVGRSPKSHLVLDPKADRQISRTHCMIDLRPPRIMIRDLESTNGTFVNDRRVGQQDLAHQDVIAIGQTRIRVLIAESSHPAPAQILCAVCCRDVGDEVSGIHPRDRESLVYTCRECRASTLIETPRPDRPLRDDFSCALCRRDLSRWSDADGLAQELQDARYLCPTCAIRERDAKFAQADMGSYRLLSELGRGGMGIVYKAVHQPTRRVVAIKQILPDAARDERARKLFDREIAVQSMVAHPNLVRVIERGRHQNTCFFAIEFLEGGDLNHLVKSVFRGPVETKLAVRFMIDVLRGLDALHQRGFVHRDLKPANVLLSIAPDKEGCLAKITDYGLAKSYEEAGNSIFDFTRAGDAAGSLMFMPPEQILDYRFVKPPADVYAAGVSLYYLLSGAYTVDFPTPELIVEMAAHGKKPRNPIQMILEDPPIPIRRRHAGIPDSLATIVDRAVQKDLDKRHASASELREDLESLAF